MNPNDFSQDILAKIEEQHLEPRPRWQFFVIRALWWVMALVTTIIGGIAFASVLFFIQEQEWDWVLSRATFADVLRSIPFAWIVIFILFAIVTMYDIRATKRGYRYETPVLLALIALSSMVLGGAVYASGYEAKPHEFLRDRLPGYRAIAPDPQMIWQEPQLGRFAGVVLATSTEGFVLRDQGGEARSITIVTTSNWLLPIAPEPGLPVKTLCEGAGTSTEWVLIEARPWWRRPARRLAPTPQHLAPVREKQRDLKELRELERSR